MLSEEVLKVLKENPSLPVYAYVATEVVADDSAYFNWLGKVKSARVAEIAFVEPYGYYDRTIVEKYDVDDYVEYLLDTYGDGEMSSDELIKRAYNKANNLPFKKYIILYIDTI